MLNCLFNDDQYVYNFLDSPILFPKIISSLVEHKFLKILIKEFKVDKP